MEKSEAIARSRRCWSSWLTRRWTHKRIFEKMEGQGGGEAQGGTDPLPQNYLFENVFGKNVYKIITLTPNVPRF
jgi:hypothetical protein